MTKLLAGALLCGGSAQDVVDAVTTKIFLQDAWLYVPGQPFFIGGTAEDKFVKLKAVDAPALEYFSMEKLSDSEALIYGGFDNRGVAVGELSKILLNVTTLTASWSKMITAARKDSAKPQARGKHATAMRGTIMYMAGGIGTAGGAAGTLSGAENRPETLKDAWTLDTKTGTWTQIADLPSARESAVAGFLAMKDADDKAQNVFVVVGGNNGAQKATSDIFIYDPRVTCAKWESCAETDCVRRKSAKADLQVKQDTCTAYCVVSPESKEAERAGHSAVFSGSTVKIFGGLDSSGSLTSDTWVYEVNHLGSKAPDIAAFSRAANGSAGGWPDQCAFARKAPAYVVPKHDMRFTPGGVKVVCLTFFIINLVVAIGLGIWTFLKRNEAVIRAAQVEFLWIIILGCILSSSSILAMIQDDQGDDEGTTLNMVGVEDGRVTYSSTVALDSACMGGIWLYSVGFLLSFAALFGKVYRVQRIFNSAKRMRKVVIKMGDMIIPIAALLIVDGAILLAFQFTNPLAWIREVKTTDAMGSPLTSTGGCAGKKDSPSVWLFLGLIFFIHILVLM